MARKYANSVERLARRRYSQQKRNAKGRGIGWEFTFESWWECWRDFWSERGLRGNGYVMSRVGDVGPYAPWNVEIVRSSENVLQPQALAKRVVHRAKHGTGNTGAHLKDRANHPSAKRVIDPEGRVWPSAALCAEEYGVTRHRIAQMCRGREKGFRYE